MVGVSLGTEFPTGVTPCPIEIQSFAPTLPIYRYAHHPRFDDFSLFVTVRSMSGPDYLVEKQFSTPERRFQYVALGDSFTSGEGEDDDGQYLPGTNTPDNRCHVSGRSYPFLLIHTPLPMTSVACSGAVTDDLILPNRGLPAQAVAIRQHQPDVVTTSIGGNDFDLVGKLAACAGPGTCMWAQPEHRRLSAQEAMGLRDRLVEVFTEVRESAPLARHFAVGYPLAIDPFGSCDLLTKLLLNTDERRYLYEAQKLLNSVIASAAQQASVKYIDVSNAFQNHALCSQTGSLAMNSLRFGDDLAPVPGLPTLKLIGNESFHPTPFGHRLVAHLVDASVERGGDVGCEAEVCESPPDPYWGQLSQNQTVWRLTYERLSTFDARVESTGLFAPGSTVAATLFSDEVDLGALTADESGSVQLTISTELLRNEAHTVLLTGLNEGVTKLLGTPLLGQRQLSTPIL